MTSERCSELSSGQQKSKQFMGGGFLGVSVHIDVMSVSSRCAPSSEESQLGSPAYQKLSKNVHGNASSQ